MNKVIIQEKLQSFTDHWNPRIIGELNGQQVKIAKLQGEFIWHQHVHEDEMFMVISGILKMEFRDRTEFIHPNEFIIVPKGIEHKPSAETEVAILLFEPASTINTGDQDSERTKKDLLRL